MKTHFSKINPVGMVKHKLYQIYWNNKDLKMFLNTFLGLSKMAKIDDS